MRLNYSAILWIFYLISNFFKFQIPFSNFALLYHGAFQDEQVPIYKEQISSIGITLADRMPGPFHLEIDYIGALHDQYYENKFRYEGYYVKEYRLRDVS